MKRLILIFLGTALAWAAQPVDAIATYYGKPFAGRLTAAGVHQVRTVARRHWRFDPQAYTCASATLALGSIVCVRWIDRWVYCMVTDRMPGPGIDLSVAAFKQLCSQLRIGVLHITVEVVGE